MKKLRFKNVRWHSKAPKQAPSNQEPKFFLLIPAARELREVLIGLGYLLHGECVFIFISPGIVICEWQKPNLKKLQQNRIPLVHITQPQAARKFRHKRLENLDLLLVSWLFFSVDWLHFLRLTFSMSSPNVGQRPYPLGPCPSECNSKSRTVA